MSTVLFLSSLHHKKVAIDTLTYKFNVMREDPADVTEGPDDGIYCHGLWLEGERTFSRLHSKWAWGLNSTIHCNCCVKHSNFGAPPTRTKNSYRLV